VAFLSAKEKSTMVKDPVCGMGIEAKDAFASRESMGQTFYFCSQACVTKFDANPHAYMRHGEKPLASPITTGVNPKLGDLRRVELPIVGLDSAASVPIIERELKAVTGVQAATVNFDTKRAFIQFDTGHADLENLTGAIKRAGFRVGGSQVRIGIQDLRCTSCVTFIEDELKATSGVLSASVNVGAQEATVEYLPEKTALGTLSGAIEAGGYKMGVLDYCRPVP
jgi:Cu+-exporting ATPase